MKITLPPEIAALEAQLDADPESYELRETVLLEYLSDRALMVHPRRIDHILWLVRHDPRSHICRCPMVCVDSRTTPEGFERINAEWTRQIALAPDDPEVLRGAAYFVADHDHNRAEDLLTQVTVAHPESPEAWLDLGLVNKDPARRVWYLQQAQQRGSRDPNLRVWIGSSAVEAGQWEVAEAIGCELLDEVARLRAVHGDSLDWPGNGREIWTRARAVTGSDVKARKLTWAIGIHANSKHWGHTFIGHVSLHRGEVDAAISHLLDSGRVVGNARLRSYGPTFSLAKKLCELGYWGAVEEYLIACALFWDDTRLSTWILDIQQHRLPAFPE